MSCRPVIVSVAAAIVAFVASSFFLSSFSFASCLRSLAKEKVDNNQSYNSIQEYIQTFKSLELSIKELLNIVD
jgi:hypothetical protein